MISKQLVVIGEPSDNDFNWVHKRTHVFSIPIPINAEVSYNGIDEGHFWRLIGEENYINGVASVVCGFKGEPLIPFFKDSKRHWAKFISFNMYIAYTRRDELNRFNTTVVFYSINKENGKVHEYPIYNTVEVLDDMIVNNLPYNFNFLTNVIRASIEKVECNDKVYYKEGRFVGKISVRAD